MAAQKLPNSRVPKKLCVKSINWGYKSFTMAQVNVAAFFGGEAPVLPNVRSLTGTVARQIQACLDAGLPGSQIDVFLGKTKGTVRRWVRDGHLRRAMILLQVELIDRIRRCLDLDKRLELLNQVTDVNLNFNGEQHRNFRRLIPLIHQDFNEPEWIQALLDRGADVNLKRRVFIDRDYFYNPIWHVQDLEVFKMLYRAGADIEELCPRTGLTLLEYLVDLESSDKYERIRFLFESGVDVQPLFDAIYNKMTIGGQSAAIRVLMQLGYAVDLKKTLVYRMMHVQIPYEELINCFFMDPNTDRDILFERYPTHDIMQARLLERCDGVLESMETVMVDETIVALDTKDEIDEALSAHLCSDVTFLISTFLYQYTPY